MEYKYIAFNKNGTVTSFELIPSKIRGREYISSDYICKDMCNTLEIIKENSDKKYKKTSKKADRYTIKEKMHGQKYRKKMLSKSTQQKLRKELMILGNVKLRCYIHKNDTYDSIEISIFENKDDTDIILDKIFLHNGNSKSMISIKNYISIQYMLNNIKRKDYIVFNDKIGEYRLVYSTNDNITTLEFNRSKIIDKYS